MALKAWHDDESDEPAIVGTPEELDRVLDVAVGWGWRAIVELFVVGSPKRAIFGVGVHGRAGVGMLCYSDARGKWRTLGGEAVTGQILYCYMNADTEFTADCEIPLDLVRQAAHEYMSSGGARPTVVDWQPLR
ncbi:Imm1 family immunity protein [Actinosynnema mirum]|uniref:Immunity protein Imm1 n=1 Tax=Actinosynnema mirum (strain ATCC 29888 / DSM 43827 / JCM 3225 / NBRC 14064 / NCIMB 13271 / NRRL B-12336 / IMRU 3971 / 101) TaxID=446462 RepID=C6WG35_ACTMD|nr:Imm1 family immunity protein [Actinosynnema mirum]ACU39799.1 hypothetical protein Amir_5992 [Actinosynnema mirum DSM 43827]